ncbi:MAG: DNA polymerase III subunit delta [Pseudomonadota bacterium]
MKLTWKQIEPFLKNPDPAARVILIYGPDNGLMKERSQMIGKTIVEDLDDPFNVVTLSAEILSDDPARLQDEAKAMSMMGGARLIKVENAADKLTPLLKEYLEDPSPNNLVLLEAGELTTRSSLRQLTEKAKNAAAIPCYVEDERGVNTLIRETLSNQGYFINSDAAQFLTANIAGDRSRIRNELEKLILYMGDEKNITLEHVEKCVGAIGEVDLEMLIYAVGASQSEKAINAYNKLIAEGVADIAILRSLQNHFRRLHYTRALMSSGQSIDQAVKLLSPPIFFKVESAFKGQVQKWSSPKLELILQKLTELETQTKQTGTPVQTLCSQAILAITMIRH